MQKIFCFLITMIPLSIIAQDKIDFYSQAPVKNFGNRNAARIYKTAAASTYNTDNHRLSIVFTVPVNQQRKCTAITGELITQAGQLVFNFSGEIIVTHKNKLEFISKAGMVYVIFNEVLRCIINDEAQAFSITNRNYQFTLTDAENNIQFGLQAESITAGYQQYYPPLSSSKMQVFTASKNNDVINIFPNPVHNNLNITSSMPVTIRVLNATGQLQFTKTITGKSAIDVSALSAGLYFLYASLGGNQYITKPFSKQ